MAGVLRAVGRVLREVARGVDTFSGIRHGLVVPERGVDRVLGRRRITMVEVVRAPRATS